VTVTAKKIVRNWWNTLGDFGLMNEQNQYNCCNMLAGFLQSCEQFGHLSHEESQELFKELTK